MNKLIHSKISAAISLLILVVLSGVLGFKLFFAYEWIDAVYSSKKLRNEKKSGILIKYPHITAATAPTHPKPETV